MIAWIALVIAVIALIGAIPGIILFVGACR
jgi:hypothetical protein